MDFSKEALKITKAIPSVIDQSQQNDRFKIDRQARMAYDMVKERREFESSDQLSYDKIRWPMYKDLIFKRRNNFTLPTQARNVAKLIGLKHAPIQNQQAQSS